MLRGYGAFIQIQRFWLRNLHTNHLSCTLWAKDQTNGSAVAARGGEAVGPQGQVMGIDLVPGMVQETTAEIKRRNLSHVTMLLMEAERLLFPDACFDDVLCGFAIFLVPHVEQALSEFFRVLRPGGKMGVTVAQDLDALSHWFGERIPAYRQRYQFPPPRPFYALGHILRVRSCKILVRVRADDRAEAGYGLQRARIHRVVWRNHLQPIIRAGRGGTGGGLIGDLTPPTILLYNLYIQK